MRMEEKYSKTKEVKSIPWHLLAGYTLVLVMLLGLFVNYFAITSHAQATGKISSTANIRKEASTSSDILGAALEGREVTIVGKTTGSDGKVWYQIFKDADTLGFVRSDFIDITEGSVPELTGTTPPSTVPAETTGGDTGNGNSPSESGVTTVQPLSATAVGREVRVRSAADTSGSLVAIVQDGDVLTVDGYATASDGTTWYRVSFLADGEDVTGFVRDDYVTLEGDLLPGAEAPEGGEGNEGAGQEPMDPIDTYQPSIDYSLNFEGDDWYLTDYMAGVNGEKYKVTQILEAAFGNEELFDKNQGTIKSQKIAIILLVILVAGLGFAVTLLIFKIKDISDDAYFSAVEKETMRNRNEKKAQGGTGNMEKNHSKVMHTVGTGGSKTGRSAGSQGGASGQRAQGSGQAKPAGSQGNASGQRPQGSGQARPAGSQGSASEQRSQGSGQARPAGSQGNASGQRPQGSGQARPAGSQGNASGQRPQGHGQARPAGNQGNASGQRPQGSGQTGPQQAARPEQQNPGWKSKNFMADEDDEFEFEFLNWDGSEE